MSFEEDYTDDEYIDNENDPYYADKVYDETLVIEKEEIVGFDPVFESVRAKITDFTKHDQMMQKKFLEWLQNRRVT
jgi:hypothetical protein